MTPEAVPWVMPEWIWWVLVVGVPLVIYITGLGVMDRLVRDWKTSPDQDAFYVVCWPIAMPVLIGWYVMDWLKQPPKPHVFGPEEKERKSA